MPSQLRSCLSTGSTIALATLVAGTLDIADALVVAAIRGGHPAGVFRFIAACLLGRGALHGGTAIEVLGFGLHFVIAAVWVTLFVLASQHLAFLRRHAVMSGLLYGLFMYAVMNLAVLPNTAMHVHVTHVPSMLANGIGALMVAVGLPIALINTRRCLGEQWIGQMT